MIVRVVVRLKDRASVRQLVHGEWREPVAVDAAQGVVEFDVPYSRVEAIVNRFAKCGVGEFLAHVKPTDQHG